MQVPRSTRRLIVSMENYKSSALYEVWKFITRRAQLEDHWYAGHSIPHEPVPLDQRIDRGRKK